MSTQSVHSLAIEKHRHRVRAPLAIALLIGLVLGQLFTILWPDLPVLATIGMWPAGTAIAMIIVGLSSVRMQDEPAWGLLISGPLIGLFSAGLLFLASLL